MTKPLSVAAGPLGILLLAACSSVTPGVSGSPDVPASPPGTTQLSTTSPSPTVEPSMNPNAPFNPSATDSTDSTGAPATAPSGAGPTGAPGAPGAAPTGAAPTGAPSVTAPAELVAAIRADLDSRGVSGASAEVVEATWTTWNDASLGCPEPGMSYTQALVDGWRIVVKAGGSTYDYRFGGDSTPLLCQTPGLVLPVPGTSTS